MLNTLINRAINISDKDNWKKEKKTVKTVLKKNGYSNIQINKAFKTQQKRCKEKKNNVQHVEYRNGEEDQKKHVYLPYVKGTTDKIGRILERHNIKSVFKPQKKIMDLICHAKDKIPLSNPGVYKIPCSCGAVYVGQTKRKISTRIKEHIRNVTNQDCEKSAVAEHSYTNNHTILFQETKQLARENHYFPRIIREAIEVKKHCNNFNREDGYKLSKTWDPVLNKIKIT